MRIGILHREDIASVAKLSGTPYFMVNSLRRHFPDIVFIGPDKSRLTRLIEFLVKAINRLSIALLGKRFLTDHNRFLRWRLSKVFQPLVDRAKCDLIYAPFASIELAAVRTHTPVIYLSDITWAKIVDYYPATTNLSGWANAEGFRIETEAMRKSAALIYPSRWAADSAVNDHGMDRSHVHVIPFGANFAPEQIPSRDQALRHSIDGQVKLLWVGVNWVRKDGKLAYDCLVRLLETGISASLIVVGCVPPPEFQHHSIQIIPFLDKNDPVQRDRLSKLYLDADFLLFPTLAEAVGVVACEASAHGLPSIVRNTGGTTSVVVDGVNGFVMPYQADGIAYAEKIRVLAHSPGVYAALVASTRQEYEMRLNWNQWGDEASRIFKKFLADAK
jgi:glycosyltransferase involved in cell wall biosynthesis